MSKFKKKAKPVQSSSSKDIDWDGYNQHILEQVNAATDDGEDPVQVCIVSAIIDTGTQPPQEEYTEYNWEDDDRQNKLLKADFGCYVDGDKFYIPNRSADTVVICVDFPSIEINYGKFFNAPEGKKYGEDDFKPYRALVAGDWKGVATPIMLAPSNGEYSSKSRIAKLAKATGAVKGTKVPADFDIGELLGGDLMMEITAEENGEYINVNVKDPSKRKKVIPIPDHNIEPIGVMIGEENDEDAIKQVNNKVKKLLKTAKEYEGSPLQKQLEGGNSDSGSEAPEKLPEKTSPKSSTKGKGKAKTSGKASTKTTKKEEAPEIDYDSEIPF